MVHVNVLYHSFLRSLSHKAGEEFDTEADNLGELYTDLKSRYGFPLDRKQMRVAVNAEFASWDESPRGGDTIAFLPPGSGG